ncbi:MAG: hypothetical protein HQL24_01960 [Candidatus Omnitrophica bacterium]|nr:hypothetical protein [Candidatus Omnitrophota bacterium]
MTKKPKLTAWHKKAGRILSSKFLRPRGSDKIDKPLENTKTDKLTVFVKNLDEQIRKASKTTS